MTIREREIIDLIHREVKPALGCTEPIAVALAASKAAEIITEKCHSGSDAWRLGSNPDIKVEVSGNILKNGMGVGIPGTGMIGLHVAATLGTVCGDSGFGLEVLHRLSPEGISRAKALTADGRVSVSIADTSHKLYAKCTVSDGACTASATVEDMHDRIVETTFCGTILESSREEAHEEGDTSEPIAANITVREIYEFATTVDYEDIKFILDDRKLNLALAEEGLSGDYGLKVGKTIKANEKGFFGSDYMSFAMGMTAAASDARMAGCTLPAMSNSGSGNQGITASMPVIAYAMQHGTDDETLARALILSNLVAIHIKGYLGRLSALCGCVVASSGSSCGIVYLEGGTYEQVCYAIKNMIGNITGMVCDGAKVGCAMKVASGVASAIQSAVLALNDIHACESDGIIERDIEKTIRNLGAIGSRGMQVTDEMILEIMVCK